MLFLFLCHKPFLPCLMFWPWYHRLLPFHIRLPCVLHLPFMKLFPLFQHFRFLPFKIFLFLYFLSWILLRWFFTSPLRRVGCLRWLRFRNLPLLEFLRFRLLFQHQFPFLLFKMLRSLNLFRHILLQLFLICFLPLFELPFLRFLQH